MIQTDKEIWTRVIALKGKELFTYVENEKNTIINVEDNGKRNDQVIISERVTFPIKEDVIAAYKLFTAQGKLKRNTDLKWLAHSSKRVSSIVSRIIGEIAADHSQLN